MIYEYRTAENGTSFSSTGSSNEFRFYKYVFFIIWFLDVFGK